MSDKLQLVEANDKLKFVEQTSGATLGTVLDGCDGGAVAAKYRSLDANLKIRTRSRKSPYLLDSRAAAA